MEKILNFYAQVLACGVGRRSAAVLPYVGWRGAPLWAATSWRGLISRFLKDAARLGTPGV